MRRFAAIAFILAAVTPAAAKSPSWDNLVEFAKFVGGTPITWCHPDYVECAHGWEVQQGDGGLMRILQIKLRKPYQVVQEICFDYPMLQFSKCAALSP